MDWLELHPPRQYVTAWRRRGGREQFRLSVTACSRTEAIRSAHARAALGLGANLDFWELVRIAQTVSDEVIPAVQQVAGQ